MFNFLVQVSLREPHFQPRSPLTLGTSLLELAALISTRGMRQSQQRGISCRPAPLQSAEAQNCLPNHEILSHGGSVLASSFLRGNWIFLGVNAILPSYWRVASAALRKRRQSVRRSAPEDDSHNMQVRRRQDSATSGRSARACLAQRRRPTTFSGRLKHRWKTVWPVFAQHRLEARVPHVHLCRTIRRATSSKISAARCS